MALTGTTNAEKIWNYCLNKGFTEFGAAGVLANADAESALNPKNLQDSYQRSLGYDDNTYTNAVDNGTYTHFVNDSAGYGLCQWTYFTRKQALQLYAKSRGVSIGDLEMQLDFMYKELSESYRSVLNTLKTATSVSEAVVPMMLKYEAPHDQSASAQNKRISLGNKYHAQFTGAQAQKLTPSMGYYTFPKGISVQLSEHFSSLEFDCHGVGCCSQTIVNEKLVDYLEKIRVHFNAPVSITSPYRCPIHNSSVGGAVGSRHGKGDAADIVVKDVAPREVAKYAESIGIKGIGLYETANDGFFVHIDTRDYKSFWYGQAEKPVTTFGGSPVTVTPNVPTNMTNAGALNTILDFGDIGDAVKTLQEKLITLGYTCGKGGADGIFGDDTYKAVKKFQSAANITSDGIVGYMTQKAIDIALESLSKAELSSKKVKVTAQLLNVRSGAGMNYAIKGRVTKNSVLEVVEEKSGWLRISEPSGWISEKYVSDV